MAISINNQGDQVKLLSDWAVLACCLDGNGNPVPIPANALQLCSAILGFNGLVLVTDGVPAAAVPFVDFLPTTNVVAGVPAAGNYRFTAAHGLEFYNATTGFWNAPTVTGAAGAEVIGLNAGEA